MALHFNDFIETKPLASQIPAPPPPQSRKVRRRPPELLPWQSSSLKAGWIQQWLMSHWQSSWYCSSWLLLPKRGSSGWCACVDSTINGNAFDRSGTGRAWRPYATFCVHSDCCWRRNICHILHTWKSMEFTSSSFLSASFPMQKSSSFVKKISNSGNYNFWNCLSKISSNGREFSTA